MVNTILPMDAYGCVEIHLKEQLDRRGLTRMEAARRTGTRFGVIDRWYKGEVGRIDLDVLARLCYVLRCDITDLIRYVPGKD